MKNCVLVILVLFSHPALCQQQTVPVFGGAEAFLFYGINFSDDASLKESLDKHGLPALDGTQMSAGAGGGVYIKNFYFGGEGGIAFGTSGSNDFYQSSAYGGYGMIKGGYRVINTSSAKIYPAIGLGGGGTAISLDAGPLYAGHDDALLLQPGDNIHCGYMLADVAVNSDLLLGSKQKPGKVLIGFTLGYRIYPIISSWSYEGENLALEKMASSFFYVQVKVGKVFL